MYDTKGLLLDNTILSNYNNEKSAFEIWNLLKESFTNSKEQRKIELTNKIEN